MDKELKSLCWIAGIIIALVLVVVVVLMASLPKYRVYKQNLAGQATLREAEWSKRVAVEDARAQFDSAELLGKADEERARYSASCEVIAAEGLAKSNKIVGESLKDNEEYIKYLWVKGLTDGSSEVIYVPTEANLPILEAGKR